MENTPIYELETGKDLGAAQDILRFLGTKFGLSSRLISDVKARAKVTTALSRLIFSHAERKKIEESHEGEGRGTYHEDGDKNIIYVKGTGSLQLVDEKSGGFPASEQTLLHEFSPRVFGESDMVENIIEHVNASVIFARLAKQNEWSNLNQALEAGVSIPLNLTFLEEQSHRLEKLWNESKERQRKYPDITWDKLGGIGTVSMIVPSKNRLSNHLYINFKESEPRNENLLNAEYVGTAARGIGQLMQQGMYYYEDGFHAQNFFDTGLTPQADNAEIGFISRILSRGPEFRTRFLSFLSEQLRTINKPGVFERRKGDLNFEEYNKYIRSFVTNLLGIDIDEATSEYLTLIASIDRYSFHNSLSYLMMSQYENESWRENTDIQAEILDKFPEAHKRVMEKDQWFADRLKDSWIYQMGPQEFDRSKNLASNIFYGDSTPNDDYVNPLVSLVSSIQESNNPEIRNIFCRAANNSERLFYLLGGYEKAKFRQLIDLIQKHDTIEIQKLIDNATK